MSAPQVLTQHEDRTENDQLESKATRDATVRQHWYRSTTTACPVCGRGDTVRERVYGPRPVSFEERYFYSEVYDWCDA